jgi:heme exporter protein C
MEGRSQSRLDTVVGLLLLVGMVLALYMAFLQAPTERTMGDLQRIFYFHMPAGVTAMIAFGVNFVASIMYLRKRNRRWDNVALAAAEVGVMLLTIVLVTGPLWAKPVWLVWWTWSPRLTSSLVLWMLYAAYLLIRYYVPDPERRASMAAVFGLVAFVDVPIVWFSIRWWRDIHPSPMVETGGLSPAMWPALWTCLAVYQLLLIYLIRRRFFLECIRDDVEALARQAEHARVEARMI